MADEDKKIILVNVTKIFRNRKLDIVFPLGMLYLAGSLKRAGYSVKIYNIATEEIDHFVNEISKEQILFIGICSILTGLKIAAAIKLSQNIKKRMDAPIVWGGLYPSSEPELCLEKNYVDMVAIGEGEELIVDIAKIHTGKLAKETVAGIAYKNEERNAVVNKKRSPLQNLDNFKPDTENIKLEDYIYDLDEESSVLPYPIMTSRGCPFDCAFCYNNAFNERKWRKYSIEYVVNHLKELKAKADFDYIILADDNAFVDKERLFAIMDQLYTLGIKICHFGLKLTNLEEEDLRKFVKYKVKSIYFGIESFQERVLKLCNKEHSREQIFRAIKLIRKHPELKVVAGIVLAMPGETFDEMRRDIREAMENITFDGNLSIFVVILFPIPKTKFYYDLINSGNFRKITRIEDWIQMNPYETEKILKIMKPNATKRDIRLVIMAKRYTEHIINLSRKFVYTGDRTSVYKAAYYIVDKFRYAFFSLSKWRLNKEIFFLSDLDFLGFRILVMLEKLGSKGLKCFFK
jgi:anaerobic magnesium-protoporphyrin IX monomethyl ester cyclase